MRGDIRICWALGAKTQEERIEHVYVIGHWVRDGVLVLEINRDEYRYIPLTALKEWTVKE